jgi:hypothetical protein
MELKRTIMFPFRGPHVWPNLGCVALCFLIPVVGALVAMGYMVTVEKLLIQNIDADAPRFNFNRFSDYLIKGVWPFLASLVLTLIVLPLMLLMVLAVVVAAALLQKHKVIMITVIVIGGLGYMTAAFLLNPLLTPLILKSGLQSSFSAAFDWKFMLDYFKRAGMLTLGMQFLLALLIFPAAILSFCIPYLGLFALMTMTQFMQTHLRAQLYLTYLDRGGTPIPFEPEPPEPAFPVIMQPPSAPSPMR